MLQAIFKLGFIFVLIAIIYKVWLPSSEIEQKTEVVTSGEAKKILEKHTEIYGSAIIRKVTDHVYVAIGYSIANMIMLEGTDGIIIIDTTESPDAALTIYKEFRKITTKPLKAIIITHFHTDHIVGASALLEVTQNSSDVQVYTHSSTEFELARFATSSDVGYRRASRQFGMFLDQSDLINAGIGPMLKVGKDLKYKIADATVTFDDEATFTVAGITFTLIHTPGETNDQITVWVPEWRVVMPADNIYESFPNLYAIRGSPPRECGQWFRSLDKVRRLRAKYMVPSHTRPLEGEEKIFDVITHYRDAIQFVQDQTIRYMNKDMEIDEIVERVRLPPSLASHPYLQEYYGKVSWSVRSVFDGQLGWFDGDPVNLEPLSKQNRMKKLEELLSSNYGSSKSAVEKMVKNADECLKKSDRFFNMTGHVLKEELQWSLELASGVLKLVEPETSIYKEAMQIAVSAMAHLAKATINANARHYYLTCAKEMKTGDKDLTAMSKHARKAIIRDTKVANIMQLFPIRFMADQCDDKLTLTIIFEFSDVSQAFCYIMRHCILEYIEDRNFFPEAFDAKLTLTSVLWKEIITDQRNAVGAYASGELLLEGSMLSLKSFMDLLER